MVRAPIGATDMEAIRKAEPYTLLEYQSSELRVFGVELRPLETNGMPGILAGLRWVGQSGGFCDDVTFLVVNLPDQAGSREIAQLAEGARAEGLSTKLCAVVSPCAHHPARTIASLQRHGIPVLLGGVGKKSRFSDMADQPLSGVVIDRALLQQACGDPHAASVLDAIVALASNLGLKSFANECATQTEFNFALSAGVSYVSFGARAEVATLPMTATVRLRNRDFGWRRPRRAS